MKYKHLNNLTKDELIRFIINELSDISLKDKFECAACGTTDKADQYYCCDKCNKLLAGDNL